MSNFLTNIRQNHIIPVIFLQLTIKTRKHVERLVKEISWQIKNSNLSYCVTLTDSHIR